MFPGPVARQCCRTACSAAPAPAPAPALGWSQTRLIEYSARCAGDLPVICTDFRRPFGILQVDHGSNRLNPGREETALAHLLRLRPCRSKPTARYWSTPATLENHVDGRRVGEI